jgi:CDP-diacylglycerol--glycerol-3-phosphate 3-phosphatidyltransferase
MIPASYFLATPMLFHREIAVLIILLAATTDILDGYFARKLDQISEVGKVIDPLADKVGVAIVVVMLTIYGDIPIWLSIGVIARDIIIFLAGLYIKHKTGIILPSLMSGKVAVSFLALYLVLAILQYQSIQWLVNVMVIVAVVTLVFSFFQYAQRFFATLHAHSAKGR